MVPDIELHLRGCVQVPEAQSAVGFPNRIYEVWKTLDKVIVPLPTASISSIFSSLFAPIDSAVPRLTVDPVAQTIVGAAAAYASITAVAGVTRGWADAPHSFAGDTNRPNTGAQDGSLNRRCRFRQAPIYTRCFHPGHRRFHTSVHRPWEMESGSEHH